MLDIDKDSVIESAVNRLYDQLIKEEDFYNDLYEFDEESFFEWVVANFNLIGEINSFSEVTPNKEDFERFVENGLVFRRSSCFHVAMSISLIDPAFQFYTGFIIQNTIPLLFAHAFNVHEGTIVDFSFYELEDKEASFPNKYVGIEIPSHYVKQFGKNLQDPDDVYPLLVNWIRDNNFVKKRES
jgi:hypothetical protein